MSAPIHRSSLAAGEFCLDPSAALGRLGKAFGFECGAVIHDQAGDLANAEMLRIEG